MLNLHTCSFSFSQVFADYAIISVQYGDWLATREYCISHDAHQYPLPKELKQEVRRIILQIIEMNLMALCKMTRATFVLPLQPCIFEELYSLVISGILAVNILILKGAV